MAVETNARIEFSVASVEEWEKVNPKLHQGEPVFAKKPSGKYVLKVGAPGGSTYKNAVVVWDQDDAETKMENTQTAAAEALASKNAASASASAAKTSETAAEGSKSAAAKSAANAKTSETNAAASKTAAANSASTASAKATAAGNSAIAAATSEKNAGSSASAAATSESNALKSANAAITSAGNAKTSETSAATSAKAAKQSEENAKTWDPTQYAKLTETLLLTKHGKKLFETNTAITDLNSVDVLSHPVWFCSYSNIAEKLSNCPTKTAFHLFNFSSSESADGTYNGHLPTITTDWVYIVQILIDIEGQVWIRKCNNSGTSTFNFTDWRKIATTNLLPTKISQLINDSNYLTPTSLEIQELRAAIASISTKTSQLTNDSGFISSSAEGLNVTNLTVTGALNIPGGKIWIE